MSNVLADFFSLGELTTGVKPTIKLAGDYDVNLTLEIPESERPEIIDGLRAGHKLFLGGDIKRIHEFDRNTLMVMLEDLESGDVGEPIHLSECSYLPKNAEFLSFIQQSELIHSIDAGEKRKSDYRIDEDWEYMDRKLGVYLLLPVNSCCSIVTYYSADNSYSVTNLNMPYETKSLARALRSGFLWATTEA